MTLQTALVNLHEFTTAFDVVGDNAALANAALANDAKGDCLVDVVKYGVYHTPKQFLARAHHVQHPMDSTDHLEGVTKGTLDFIFQYLFRERALKVNRFFCGKGYLRNMDDDMGVILSCLKGSNWLECQMLRRVTLLWYGQPFWLLNTRKQRQYGDAGFDRPISAG